MTLTSKFDKIQQRAAMVAPMPITLVDSDLRRRLARNQRASTRLIDETLEDSFPASDLPPGPSVLPGWLLSTRW